jgi:hypothetical protein
MAQARVRLNLPPHVAAAKCHILLRFVNVFAKQKQPRPRAHERHVLPPDNVALIQPLQAQPSRAVQAARAVALRISTYSKCY